VNQTACFDDILFWVRGTETGTEKPGFLTPASQNSPHPHKGPSAKIDKKTWFLRDANVTSCAKICVTHIND